MNVYSLSAVATAIALMTSTASATVVTQTQIETADAQAFSFALATPSYSANSASSLTLTVQGDFDGGIGGAETVSISIEGTSYGTFSRTSPQVFGVIDYRTGTSNFNALLFNVNFLLNSFTTNSLLADGILNVVVNFGAGVNVDCGWSNTSNCLTGSGNAPFAKLTFDYATASNVPEPGSLALLGLGLAGAFVARSRKAKQA